MSHCVDATHIDTNGSLRQIWRRKRTHKHLLSLLFSAPISQRMCQYIGYAHDSQASPCVVVTFYGTIALAFSTIGKERRLSSATYDSFRYKNMVY
ncbi:MAG: hypothetical protein KatS3mg058_2151 [Roseiflexus sp.]|nr:MAG: hypothetical protein KatS3mg058_2151 [Roseiflexus sp.]